jgi:hypothetical protein
MSGAATSLRPPAPGSPERSSPAGSAPWPPISRWDAPHVALHPGDTGADSESMTPVPHSRDWKVSRLYRFLVIVGWGVAALSVYFAVLAVIFGLPELWGTSAVLSAAVVGLGAVLPEPVPRDMLIGGSTRVVVGDL